MRAIWKGTIGFGLVSIPVKMYNATEERGPRLHLVHARCGKRIQLKRFCSYCETLIDWKDVKSGYEVSREQMVVVEESDLEALPLRTLKSIDVEEFVDASQIDPILYREAYYLAPDEGAAKPFSLMLKALEASGLVAIGKMGYREKEQIVLLRPREGVLLLQVLLYADQIRSPNAIAPAPVAVSERETSLAITLINTLKREKFDPTRYRDEYSQALRKVIEAKLQGLVLAAPEAPRAAPADLVDTLLASIKMAKGEG